MGLLSPLTFALRKLVFHTVDPRTILEATQGQIDGFFSQLPYKCHQNRVASVGD